MRSHNRVPLMHIDKILRGASKSCQIDLREPVKLYLMEDVIDLLSSMACSVCGRLYIDHDLSHLFDG